MAIEESGTEKTHVSVSGTGATLAVPSGTAYTSTLPLVHWRDEGPVLQAPAQPRYERLALLGEGGMGEVVRARDNDIGREVAIKRLRADLQRPELFARFVEEVRTVGQLEHPNIVPIHDAGLDEQGYFFVMKHVEGLTLATLISRLNDGDPATHRRWPLERRIDVMRKVLEALRYAHQKGVVHRDVKPANILVGPLGEVFLLDWGIARRARDGGEVTASAAATSPSTTNTQAGRVMGTPLYMSPEQAQGQSADVRSDLYSFCMTFYEFVTLRHPFALLSQADVLRAVVSRPIPHATLQRHPHQPTTPMEVGWLLKKGLEKHPANRYQTADELIQRLDDRAEGKVPVQCHVTATQRAGYEVMRQVNRFPGTFLFAALAGLCAATYLLTR